MIIKDQEIAIVRKINNARHQDSRGLESDLILLNAETDWKKPIERRPRNRPDFYWIQSTKIG